MSEPLGRNQKSQLTNTLYDRDGERSTHQDLSCVDETQSQKNGLLRCYGYRCLNDTFSLLQDVYFYEALLEFRYVYDSLPHYDRSCLLTRQERNFCRKDPLPKVLNGNDVRRTYRLFKKYNEIALKRVNQDTFVFVFNQEWSSVLFLHLFRSGLPYTRLRSGPKVQFMGVGTTFDDLQKNYSRGVVISLLSFVQERVSKQVVDEQCRRRRQSRHVPCLTPVQTVLRVVLSTVPDEVSFGTSRKLTISVVDEIFRETTKKYFVGV